VYKIKPTGQFKKDIKACSKANYNLSLMATAIDILIDAGTLPFEEYQTHKLTGFKADIWDAHIKSDWLLLWRVEESDEPEYDGIIILLRTGTHSNLFGKKQYF